MNWVPQSYARAAGHQSEISNSTLTRVAGDEMEYRRRIKVYKKDMQYNISTIQRSQRILKRSMVGYSRKLKASKENRNMEQKRWIEREKQEKLRRRPPRILSSLTANKEDVVNVQSESEHIGAVSQSLDSDIVVEDILETNVDTYGMRENENQTITDDDEDDVCIEDGGVSRDSNIQITKQNGDVVTGSQHMHEPTKSFVKIRLPSIKEDSTVSRISKEKNNTLLSQKTKKKKSITYMDLIKLQHSSNKKGLFSLVNRLAKLHGIKDKPKESAIKDTRTAGVHPKLISISQRESMTNVLNRTASVYYNINYGYDVGSDESADVTVESDRSRKSPMETSGTQNINGPVELTNSLEQIINKTQNVDTLDFGKCGGTKLQRTFTLPPITYDHGTHNREHVKRRGKMSSSNDLSQKREASIQAYKKIMKADDFNGKINWTMAMSRLKVLHVLSDNSYDWK